MSSHIPVLVDESIAALQVVRGDTIIDGTFGGGGHAKFILEQLAGTGRLIGVDRDPLAIEQAEEWTPENTTLISANYADIPELLPGIECDQADGILLDLGLSSDQLQDDDRGFSFHSDGLLDLRFDQTAGEPAWRLVNRLGETHLANLIYEFGEEKFSRRIARKICDVRHQQPIKTASQLARLVRSCVPRPKQKSIDPATRTFQALRIGVNQELKWLSVAVKRLPGILATGGRIAIISFHSLEDRIVKTAFAADERLQVITKRPITASAQEVDRNPRSRSAKLRVAERV